MQAMKIFSALFTIRKFKVLSLHRKITLRGGPPTGGRWAHTRQLAGTGSSPAKLQF